MDEEELQIVGPETKSGKRKQKLRSQIPCCLCGRMIYANAVNQCSTCLAQQYDLKSLLQLGPGGEELVIHQCRECRRFDRSLKAHSTNYGGYELESPELLRLCLKKIPALQEQNKRSVSSKGFSNMKIADAIWVWTEPNSMRLRIHTTVRATIGESQNTTVQQRIMITFLIKFKQCPECNRTVTNRTWHALVQLRQKSSRRALFTLEMAIARRPDLRTQMLRVETTRLGFDFYFLHLNQAQQFVGFLNKILPLKTSKSQKMVSSNAQNHTANIKHTIVCELVPLTRHDLVLVGRNASMNMSNRVCLVGNISKSIQLLDANCSTTKENELMSGDLYPEQYWKNEKYIKVLCTQRDLTSFVVLNIESDWNSSHSYQETEHNIVEVELARESDFGKNNVIFRTLSHIGHLIAVGDTVLGYDLTRMILPTLPSKAPYSITSELPDVVIIKKFKGTDFQQSKKKESIKSKAKSSQSKKREKRRMRQMKKEQELEESAIRMGLIEEEEQLDDEEKAQLDAEKDAFKKEMLEDSDLEQEVNDYLNNYEVIPEEEEEVQEEKKSENKDNQHDSGDTEIPKKVNFQDNQV